MMDPLAQSFVLQVDYLGYLDCLGLKYAPCVMVLLLLKAKLRRQTIIEKKTCAWKTIRSESYEN